jgi:hypothetical protein
MRHSSLPTLAEGHSVVPCVQMCMSVLPQLAKLFVTCDVAQPPVHLPLLRPYLFVPCCLSVLLQLAKLFVTMYPRQPAPAAVGSAVLAVMQEERQRQWQL